MTFYSLRKRTTRITNLDHEERLCHFVVTTFTQRVPVVQIFRKLPISHRLGSRLKNCRFNDLPEKNRGCLQLGVRYTPKSKHR